MILIGEKINGSIPSVKKAIEEKDGKIDVKSIKMPLRGVAYLEIELESGLTATEKIISELDKHNLKDKIVLMKLKGILKEGKTGDIQFNEIESFVRKKEAYVFLRNISSLKLQEVEFGMTSSPDENVENIEKRILGEYSTKNQDSFNKYLPQLMSSLSLEKNEDEKSAVFEERLISELKEVLNIKEVI